MRLHYLSGVVSYNIAKVLYNAVHMQNMFFSTNLMGIEPDGG